CAVGPAGRAAAGLSLRSSPSRASHRRDLGRGAAGARALGVARAERALLTGSFLGATAMHACRRRLLASSIAVLGAAAVGRSAFGTDAASDARVRPATLTLAGPPASVSNPLVHMAESGALADLADEVRFTGWRDPDQLRLMALDGKADVLAMPVNVAANLYNRGAKLRLVNVSTWGILWIVSRDPAVHALKDLVGEEIAMPFRGDMPDIVFGLLAERKGIDPRKDLRLRYVAS